MANTEHTKATTTMMIVSSDGDGGCHGLVTVSPRSEMEIPARGNWASIGNARAVFFFFALYANDLPDKHKTGGKHLISR